MEEALSSIQKNKKKILSSLTTTLLAIWGITLLIYPLVVAPLFTDPFIFPKQLVIAIAVIVSLILWGAKILLGEKVIFRRSPFDIAIGIFTLALILSSLFAVNRLDSFLQLTPLLFSILGYFIIVNNMRSENSIVFLLGASVISTVLLALLAIFSYFKVFPLPFAFTHIQAFTPLGSPLEQLFLFFIILPITLYFAYPIIKGNTNSKVINFAIAALILIGGIFVTGIQLLTTQKPVLLPFETGFQTAFAAISQDTGRVAQGFFFGSGYGNFETVFDRFKQISFNSNPTLWSISFTNSSSFILELLATTGIMGLLSFLFLVFRIINHPTRKMQNPLFFSVLVIIAISFILPYSFIEINLLFVLLAVFTCTEALIHPQKFFDVELRFVALKKGLFTLSKEPMHSTTTYESTKVIAFAASLIFFIMAGVSGYFTISYVLSDYFFQQSLIAAANKNGTATYKDQVQAISIFPYRSAYYRIFAQTNMAIANSLSTSLAGTGTKKPTTQQQQTLYSLIQQSINAGRTATSLAPETVANWQNLSSVYRALIGFGQNAENFAILSAQQATILDPVNPQEYLVLGGIYYQLGQYDNAIRQFQIAANLKPDYANAYFNIGHAYEQKGDLQSALTAYKTTANIVANDKQNLGTVNADIQAIEAKIGKTAQTTQTQPVITKQTPSGTQQPLNIPQAQTQLPTQLTPVPLPPPNATGSGH